MKDVKIKELDEIYLDTFRSNFAQMIIQNIFFLRVLFIIGLYFLFALRAFQFSFVFLAILIISDFLFLTFLPFTLLLLWDRNKQRRMEARHDLKCVYCGNSKDIEFKQFPSFFEVYNLPVCVDHLEKYQREAQFAHQTGEKRYLKYYLLLFVGNFLISLIVIILMTIFSMLVLVDDFPFQLGFSIVLLLLIISLALEIVLFIFAALKIYLLLKKINFPH